MDKIKKILRKFDLFGVFFTFRFDKKESYSTSLGGLFILLFLILSMYLIFYNFISFIHRDKFSTIYYTINIPKTEKIVLKDSKTAFTIGFECYEDEKYKVKDLFELTAEYIIYEKSLNNTFNKTKIMLGLHSCNYEDFYNIHNEEFDRLDFTRYYCLNDKDQVITGVWDDHIFTYYEFSVASKNSTDKNLDNIEEYLFNNDCKLQLYYTDINIDLDNYSHPIVPYLGSAFIQLNPTLFIKRNIYFMNQYLTDDDWLFGIINDDKKHIQIKTLYSRHEEYFLYLGLNRSVTKPPHNRYSYAKVYIRADTKKTIIKRNYQKLMEFYANATSLLIGIFRALVIIFNFINNFYAENSLSRRIFFFKEFENINNINISKRYKKIKELISLTDLISNGESEISSFETNLQNFSNDIKVKNNYEIKTYNNHIKRNIRNNYKSNSFSFTNEKNSRINIKLDSKNELNSSSKNYKEDSKNSYEQSKIKNFNCDNMKSPKSQNKKTKELEYSFNVLEILISSFCKCCMTKELILKHNINMKANDIIYTKLDIISYIRNMILIDLMNETLLDENKKVIFNFLCRPILSVDKVGEYSFSEFYQNYKENDFEKLYEGISGLIQKPDKEDREQRMIFLVHRKLKEFYI